MLVFLHTCHWIHWRTQWRTQGIFKRNAFKLIYVFATFLSVDLCQIWYSIYCDYWGTNYPACQFVLFSDKSRPETHTPHRNIARARFFALCSEHAPCTPICPHVCNVREDNRQRWMVKICGDEKGWNMCVLNLVAGGWVARRTYLRAHMHVRIHMYASGWHNKSRTVRARASLCWLFSRRCECAHFLCRRGACRLGRNERAAIDKSAIELHQFTNHTHTHDWHATLMNRVCSLTESPSSYLR